MKNKQRQTPFVPGLTLAGSFFHEIVKPVLKSHFPALRYSAALIGSGSEVLEFDTEMSIDHHWGPRVMLFLRPADFKSKPDRIRTVLSNELPLEYRGYPTNFSDPNPDDNGTQVLKPVVSGPINHRVELFTMANFFNNYMNIDIEKELEPVDWLTLPHQKLRSVTAGRIFHDDLGLETIRVRFSWYPHDVWLYILASAWTRIGQEEHLMGRAGSVGDEIGSAIIGSRLVRDIMRLAFFMEKEYPPYAKWLGTAFSQLKSGGKLGPVLTGVLYARTWKEREANLCTAYKILAERHNALKITEPLSPEVYRFWSRPFKVIGGERFARAIKQQIKDTQVMALARKSLVGSIDLFSDNTDLLEDASFRQVLRSLYR